jgi:TonB family protein
LFLRKFFLVCFAPLLFAQVKPLIRSVEGQVIKVAPILGSPFSATAVTEVTTVLPNGAPRVSKSFSHLARDAKGRTFIESYFPLVPTDTGEGRVRGIKIADPTAHTITELNVSDLHANVYNLPVTSAPTPPSGEDLGVTDMEGLAVHGFRSSEAVPGPNGEPAAVIRESWYSEQLQINIKSQNKYPDGGIETLTLSQVSLNEPDPTLFQVPPEYKLTDAHDAVHIGSAVAEANLITRVEPQYPALAKRARIQGTVEFTATIGKDGTIQNLQLVRGHPLLVNPAKEAVLQWKYHPTLLNGNPTTVIAPIQVTFTLPAQN